ncbi:MAG: hypothetical protein ACYDDP_07050 [Acidithiobacillus sp.]
MTVSPTGLLAALGEVLLDKKRALRPILSGFLAGGHVLVEDVPGVGKTTLSLGVRQEIVLSPDNGNYLFALATPYHLNIPVTYREQADKAAMRLRVPALRARSGRAPGG